MLATATQWRRVNFEAAAEALSSSTDIQFFVHCSYPADLLKPFSSRACDHYSIKLLAKL